MSLPVYAVMYSYQYILCNILAYHTHSSLRQPPDEDAGALQRWAQNGGGGEVGAPEGRDNDSRLSPVRFRWEYEGKGGHEERGHNTGRISEAILEKTR
jgi:hypothetical protein